MSQLAPPTPWFWPWLLALTTYGAALVALLWPQRWRRRPAAHIPAPRRPADDTEQIPR